MEDIKLTQYSHGSGCGCKIAPKLLDTILKSSHQKSHFKNLLVGNSTKDDAAAYDLGNGTSVLSTTDFFMPIVDDPFTFGKIAATNAMSDIYAMGGKPLMAIAIFGWPIDKLDANTASKVIDGGRSVCEDAGIALAGGHSIDSPEPIFGLAVTGLVENRYLKRNDTAKDGCEIFLTKPLGIGIYSTAQKQNKISKEDLEESIATMCQLNSFGEKIAKLPSVTAVTDVTGFGLLGHLSEICEGSGVSAKIFYEKVPKLRHVKKYLELGCIPGGTKRNFDSYGHKIAPLSTEQKNILCDPQTSGGLLCLVKKEGVDAFLKIAKEHGLALESIGESIKQKEHLIEVV